MGTAKRRLVWLLVVAVVAGLGLGGYLYTQSRGNVPRYRLGRVERGPLTASVSATGNLNAVILVQVGSQISGQIKQLFADFNTVVKRGQIVAKIDPETFQAKVDQARADVESAKATVLNQEAQVARARSDVENARAAYAEGRAQTAKAEVAVVDTRRTRDRNAELFKRDLIAAADRDTAQAAADSAVAQHDSAKARERALAVAIQTAEAQLKVQQATLDATRAQVRQKQAALQQALIDLERTTIRAPVDGVVVSRQVDVGQTVAASLQAPVLFTIAQDLTQMQVETSVDEADVGRIKLGDQATFTVDAFPGETFTGRVSQIRKAAQIVQNVVTYTVIVAVDNPGGRLLPGMTANVKLVFARKGDVLKVPNSALRFRPAGAEPAPGGAAPAPGGGAPAPGGQRAAGRPSAEAIRDRLVKELKLTEEQQRQLDPILEESRQQMTALQGASEQERQSRGQRIRETARTRIREILTPEQRARYDEMQGERDGRSGVATSGRVWVVGEDGKPRAVAVTLGITDGAATEVLRGELKEGQDVIVGTVGGGNAPGPSAPSGPRLRL